MYKHFLICAAIVIYVIRHDPTQNVPVVFEGMTEDQITAMYQKDGVSFDFIDEGTFQTMMDQSTVHNSTPTITGQ
jgi:hypothetical protein